MFLKIKSIFNSIQSVLQIFRYSYVIRVYKLNIISNLNGNKRKSDSKDKQCKSENYPTFANGGHRFNWYKFAYMNTNKLEQHKSNAIYRIRLIVSCKHGAIECKCESITELQM